MSAAPILAFYCVCIILASLAGGGFPLFARLTHRSLEMAISLVAGVILGVGLLRLLPHAAMELGAIQPAMGWMLTGFLVMFFLDRFFHFHHHDAPGPSAAAPGHGTCDHDHGHDHGHEHEHGHEHLPHRQAHEIAPRVSHASFSWSTAAIGMTVHSLIEGLALAAAVAAEFDEDGAPRWVGFGAFLAIVLHKPLDSLTVGTLMVAVHRPPRDRLLANVLFALVVPVGVVAYWCGAGAMADEQSRFLGAILAFAAGAFVCIASSDLLPELQFHSHDRIKLSALLSLGIAVSVGIAVLERGEHSHGKPGDAHHAHEHSH